MLTRALKEGDGLVSQFPDVLYIDQLNSKQSASQLKWLLDTALDKKPLM